MDYVLGLIGAIIIALGLYSGFQLYQAMQTPAGVLLQNPLGLVQYAGPASLVVSGIVMIAAGVAIRYLRQIRDSTDRAAHYLYAIARPGTHSG